MEFVEGVAELGGDRRDLDLALRHRAVQRGAALLDVLHLRALGRGTIERRLRHFLIRNRNAEARAERLDFLVVQLLLLVGDVLAFAGLADAVALDGAGEDQRGHALGFGGALERVVDLFRIVAAERQLLELLVREVLDHLEQARMRAPEMLAHVGAGLDRVLLILAVDDFAHALDEQAFGVLLEQGIPLGAPDALDDVPAGAAEDRFELLDDLAVAAHRSVEALQVAVDHEDQVVELFARRERDGAERLGFVGFAVAEERPHLRVGLRLEAAIFEVAIEARLVDRHDRAEAHRDRREFPEVRHQPRVRIRRQPAAGLNSRRKLISCSWLMPAFEKRARVDARRAVALEINDVAFVAVVAAAEEVVVAHLVQRRGRGERGDVAADAVFDACWRAPPWPWRSSARCS